MKLKFWKKTIDQSGGTGAVKPKTAKPKELPQAVGRKMVVEMKMDPDMVWALKYVSRPAEGKKGAAEFRLINPDTVRMAGLAIKDWSSLNDRPDLVLYSGCYDKEAHRVDFD